MRGHRRALAVIAAIALLQGAVWASPVAARPLREPARARVRTPEAVWAEPRRMSRDRDDWEPALATGPDRPFVYVLVTRIDAEPACRNRCPVPAILLRISRDGGRTFGPARPICTCRGVREMFDPQIEVTADGTVYASWMNDFHIVFAKSEDRGRSWSKPIPVYLPRRWSDKPILATDRSGRDVYVAFNGPSEGDAYVAQSHDFGETWQKPIKVVDSNRYFFAGGGQVLPDGSVAFAEASETQNAKGPVRIHSMVSGDGGATWQSVVVDEVETPPACTSDGCYDSFYGAGTALAAEASGRLLIAYTGARVPGGGQRTYVRSSGDGGATWSDRREVSPRGAVAGFPAAVGGGPDEFRIWYMDDRRGADAWNVWYRQSFDDGRTWTRAARISADAEGAVYVSAHGFGEPYGDYGEIGVTSRGRTVAVWGAGPSYRGPGGVWFTRSI